jgi:hypothetical protein
MKLKFEITDKERHILYRVLYAVRFYSRDFDTRDKPFCFIFWVRN